MLILYGTDIKFHENVLIHRKNQLSNFIHTLLSLKGKIWPEFKSTRVYVFT